MLFVKIKSYLMILHNSLSRYIYDNENSVTWRYIILHDKPYKWLGKQRVKRTRYCSRNITMKPEIRDGIIKG